jgi:hypothetical protein
LTAEQKAQTITEIRKQTGCGTCGPRVAKMGNDWQYGGVRSLVDVPGVPSCPAPGASGSSTLPKGAGATVTMASRATQGVAPYTISFRRANAQSVADPVTLANYVAETYEILAADLAAPGAPYVEPAGTAGVNPVSNVPENGQVQRVYTLATADINEATSKAAGTEGASLIFASLVTDSCGTPANQNCLTSCKIFVACPTPVCDFTVS